MSRRSWSCYHNRGKSLSVILCHECRHTLLLIQAYLCSYLTLGNPKSYFLTLLSIYLRLFPFAQKKTSSNCCSAALAVYLLLFSASYFLHSPSTASGARYRRSACIDMDILRLAAVACCDMGWISAQRGVLRDWTVSKKDWKHVLMQNVVTLNTCCDIACLTLQLPHITTGSFQSYRWQPTTGSFRGLKRLKKRNKPWVTWKSLAIYKSMW